MTCPVKREKTGLLCWKLMHLSQRPSVCKLLWFASIMFIPSTQNRGTTCVNSR